MRIYCNTSYAYIRAVFVCAFISLGQVLEKGGIHMEAFIYLFANNFRVTLCSKNSTERSRLPAVIHLTHPQHTSQTGELTGV